MLRTLGVAGALLASPMLLGGDWPRFRGPGGSGISADTKPPAAFGPDRNVAWKVAVPPGHSSPVVCGTQLYLTSFTDTELRTHAIAIESGRTLWERALPRERKAKHHGLNNAASPTPTCDAAGVVVYFADYGIAAWKRDGKPAWTLPQAPLVNNHGMASSPVLAGGRVVQVVGSDQGSQVLVLQRGSGKLLWQQQMRAVTYATPAVTPDEQVLVLSTGELVSFDLASGKRRWWVTGLPYQPKASPVLSADGKTGFFAVLSVDEGSKKALSSYEALLRAFDGNGDGQITIDEMRERKGPVGAFAQIDMNGDNVFTRQEQEEIMKIATVPHTAAAVSTGGSGDQTTKLLWTVRKGVPNVASPLVMAETLLLLKEGGIVTTLRTADGTVVKEGRVRAAFGPAWVSPILVGDRILMAGQDGKFTLLKASAEWEVLDTVDLGEESFATPALSGDRLFIRTQNTLWCFRSAP